jgi:hypothetical protein
LIFSGHKFSTFSSLVVAFLARNLESGYLGLFFSCVTDGDCGCSFVFDRSFLLLSMNIYLSLMLYVYIIVLCHSDDFWFVYDAEMLGVHAVL